MLAFGANQLMTAASVMTANAIQRNDIHMTDGRWPSGINRRQRIRDQWH